MSNVSELNVKQVDGRVIRAKKRVRSESQLPKRPTATQRVRSHNQVVSISHLR